MIPQYARPDTLTIDKSVRKNEPSKISGSMSLDVDDFDCHNKMMTSDLRKTLKAKNFPTIFIRFINLNRYPDADREDAIKGTVIIELAGVSKRFDVDYRYIPLGGGNLRLIGTKQVNFSDFNISAPRKLGGMIKTNNELSVEFILNVKILK